MKWHSALTTSDYIDLIMLRDEKRFDADDLICIFNQAVDCKNPPKDVVQ